MWGGVRGEFMRVPLFDLTRQYNKIREQVLSEIDKTIAKGRVILGENVRLLEREMSEFIGVKHAIGVANGSDALYIALKSLKIENGDAVITTAYSFFATASCITRNGGIPVFSDIDLETYNIDLYQVENILNTHPLKKRIRAIIPVHLFGQTVNLEKLEEFREKYGVKILEDCAQSIGSTWRYADGTLKKSGAVGDAAIFSFFPTKNLGAYGDAGMIITNQDEIADFCKVCRVHGSKQKYIHDFVGINSRLDEIQAAILRVKMRYLAQYQSSRIQVAKSYQDEFKKFANSIIDDPSSKSVTVRWDNVSLVLPKVSTDASHVFHQYVVRFDNFSRFQRDALRDFLSARGVGTSVYYPQGLHQQRCFAEFVPNDLRLLNTEKAAEQTLGLPIFPEIRREEISYVVEMIHEGLKEIKP